MNAPLKIFVEGIGVWAQGLPGWEASRYILCGKMDNATISAARPTPDILPPAERRRAPESVLLALDVAQQACAMAQRDPRDLPNVFASAYGDLAINDYLCATLARDPGAVSPTRFHNSVHNAAAGYWCIATGCMRSSTALSAGSASFGAGLLEAALLAHTESAAVLFVASDVAATGPLRDVIDCTAAFGVALVLTPQSVRAIARLRLTPRSGNAPELAPEAAVLHAAYRTNPAARSLPLLHALARKQPGALTLAAAAGLMLDTEILPWTK